ncbi:hypothetical protein FKG94_14535 [Exilibacterium tricleocarpae]|uniref:Fibronectin type-III domain-containing protein n=1 Tax=Exilibacterium tricleocarpae TaxID=2591008 RepID=A0A545TM00_9GAMM|nr:hypothetical protein [Exilibacterium tricleocarpae]TQV78277.1 hypothetical protein FKG94_14535 [Exilibacterium tricleocarpae]
MTVKHSKKVKVRIWAAFASYLFLTGCGGESSDSPQAQTPPAPPLPAPATVSASDGTSADAVHIRWTPVDAAEGYLVYARWQADADYTLLGEVSESEFLDSGASQQTRQYAVRAVGEDKQPGLWSEPDYGHLALSAACATAPEAGEGVQQLGQLKRGFERPRVVAFDDDGFMYVGDDRNLTNGEWRIVRLNHDLYSVAIWVGTGRLLAMTNSSSGMSFLIQNELYQRELLRLNDDCTSEVIAGAAAGMPGGAYTDLAVGGDVQNDRFYMARHAAGNSNIVTFDTGTDEGSRQWPVITHSSGPPSKVESIAVDAQDDNRLYVADARRGQILELRLDGDNDTIEVVNARDFPMAETEPAVSWQMMDLVADAGSLFLAARSDQGDTTLMYFPDGLDGEVDVQDIGSGFRNRVTEIDMHPISRHLYMVDDRNSSLYICEAPAYTCSAEIPGGSLVTMVQDTSGSIYMAYAYPGYISKLDRQGNHVVDYLLPENLTYISDMKIKGDRLYLLTGENIGLDPRSWLLEVKTDFSESSISEVPPADTNAGFAASLVPGEEDIFVSVFKASAEDDFAIDIYGIESMTGEFDFLSSLADPGYILIPGPLAISPDNILYFTVESFPVFGHEWSLYIAKYDLANESWLPSEFFDGVIGSRIGPLRIDSDNHLIYLVSNPDDFAVFNLVRQNLSAGERTEVAFDYPFDVYSMMLGSGGEVLYFYNRTDHSLYRMPYPPAP